MATGAHGEPLCARGVVDLIAVEGDRDARIGGLDAKVDAGDEAPGLGEHLLDLGATLGREARLLVEVALDGARRLGVATEGLVGAREVVEEARHARELVGALKLRERALEIAHVEELGAAVKAHLGLGARIGLLGRTRRLRRTRVRGEQCRRERREREKGYAQGKFRRE